MRIKHTYIIIATVFTVAMFFSCKNNFKEVQQVGVLQNKPIGEAKHINLKYTDSGIVKANLLSPKMLDFSNRNFSFSEFPDGVHLILYDENNNENVVVSDYAIVYTQTDLIDLQGNVILATHTNDTLFADQLYYDQRREWLFTNESAFFKSASGSIGQGNIFDSDTKFENYLILEGSGVSYIDE
ncbi:LPS export ABC transporter periplasmic protein LptC [Ichthyenterobacterium magnum]|uniref:LPS export ABC transporter protein LptC n=1 Tax=Ichthyenterobacterium magnum TaxID=1230530 RepID=A0A420DVY9_9FLAO|nr:LPS export ABC transporter periplasmic protein LptC [Ichthyenterobacterium magnum]RKE98387.1 LPS export ABC transporter protein LptC [Ichthyenterobacterium magnum]